MVCDPYVYRTGIAILSVAVGDRAVQSSGRTGNQLFCNYFLVCSNLERKESEFAGAGASVPLPGFGNTLFKGVKEAVDEYGFLGIFLGGLKASAAGISAALIFAYLASIIFQPKMKK